MFNVIFSLQNFARVCLRSIKFSRAQLYFVQTRDQKKNDELIFNKLVTRMKTYTSLYSKRSDEFSKKKIKIRQS